MLPSLQQIAQALGGKVHGNEVHAPGPGHSTRDSSLSITYNDSGDDIVVHCFSPKDDPIAAKDYVRTKCGMEAWKPNNKFNNDNNRNSPKSGNSAAAARIVATYDYTDENGVLLYQVVRYEPKGFRQRRPDGNGGWIWNLDGVRRVPYRLPELLRFPDATVIHTEGEKDADRVAALGHCTTTVAHGKWTSDCIQALAGRDVLILEDNDEPGLEKAENTAKALHGTAASIRIVRLPELGPRLPRNGKDVSDWLNAHPSRAEQFVDVCMAAPLWKPANPDNQQASLIKSSAQFLADFTPPDYLIDGLLQRRFCYSFTALTNGGKTAVCLLFSVHIALGRLLNGREVACGRVLYLAGENPDDVRMRWIAMAQHLEFNSDTIDVHFIPGVFKISELKAKVHQEAERLGGLALIIVDTSAAYFEGDNENDNPQMLKHAKLLRSLTEMPSGPTVIVASHPVKNATNENLIPRGGGGFLNEMDGNLCCINSDDVITVNWQGKFRGPPFDPIPFQLSIVTADKLRDSKGRLIPTAIAKPLDDKEHAAIETQKHDDEDAVLIHMLTLEHEHVSLAGICEHLGWMALNGKPQRWKAQRLLKQLEKERLTIKVRDRYTLTDKGKKAAKTASYNKDAKGAKYG
jgi:AAA domain